MMFFKKPHYTLEENVYNLTERVERLEESGTGTTDYVDLDNKPSINGVTLVGNKTGDDLGLGGSSGTNNYQTLENKPSINGHVLNGNQTAAQLGIVDTDTTYTAGTGLKLTGTTFSSKITMTYSNGVLNIYYED